MKWLIIRYLPDERRMVGINANGTYDRPDKAERYESKPEAEFLASFHHGTVVDENGYLANPEDYIP